MKLGSENYKWHTGRLTFLSQLQRGAADLRRSWTGGSGRECQGILEL